MKVPFIYWSLVVPFLSLPLQAQNSLNFAISTGPAYSISHLPGVDRSVINNSVLSRINYYLEFHWQYLFKDEFGLESGFYLATKNAGIQDQIRNDIYIVHVDSHSFPFLVVLKRPHPSNPFKALNFLAGTTIEYQYFLDRNELENLGRYRSVVPNITLGARVSFKRGVLGKLETGITANYALNEFFTLGIEGEKGNTLVAKPQMHFIKLDLIYYFLNKYLN